MTIEPAIVVAGALNAVLVGAMWGSLSESHKSHKEQTRRDFEAMKEELGGIKRSLGTANGSAPVFARASECRILEEAMNRRLGDIREELASLRDKLDNQGG